MTFWQRMKSSTGWGLFLGLCDWVLASAVARKLPGDAVVAIVIAQAALGAIVGAERWKAAWWLKGLVLGLAVNVPLAAALKALRPQWGGALFLPLILAGAAIGVLLEFIMKKKP